jgi:hypothetical protein
VRYFNFSVPDQLPTIPWSVTVEEIADAIRGEIPANSPAAAASRP